MKENVLKYGIYVSSSGEILKGVHADFETRDSSLRSYPVIFDMNLFFLLNCNVCLIIYIFQQMLNKL
jgi:hypothetical protein